MGGADFYAPPNQDYLDIPAKIVLGFAGGNVVVNVGFQWDGGVPLWSPITIPVPRVAQNPTLFPTSEFGTGTTVIVPPVITGWTVTGNGNLRVNWQPAPCHACNVILTALDTGQRLFDGSISGDDHSFLRTAVPGGHTYRFTLQRCFKGVDDFISTCSVPVSEDIHIPLEQGFRPTGPFVPGERVGAVCRTPTNVDVFSVDAKGQVRTTWWAQASSWADLGGAPASLGGAFTPGAPVASIARTASHLDLFVTGPDGVVSTAYWAGTTWTPWRRIGGVFPANAPVTAVSRVTNQIDLFVIGGDGHVHTQYGVEGGEWTGINNNWTALGGRFPSGAPVAAASRVPERIDLLAVGTDGTVLWSWWQQGADWSGIGNNNWVTLGGSFTPGAPITVISRTPQHIDLFVTGGDGEVYTSYQQGGAAWDEMAPDRGEVPRKRARRRGLPGPQPDRPVRRLR